MPLVTLTFSVMLILLGVGTWLAAGQTSATALIPSFFGVALGFAGLLALKDRWRRHAMHLAALIALVGTAGSLSRAIPALSDGPMRIATMSQLAMGFGLIVFVFFCVLSFISARKSSSSETEED